MDNWQVFCFHCLQGVAWLVLVTWVLCREYFVLSPRHRKKMDALKYQALQMRQVVTDFGNATVKPEIIGVYEGQISARLYGVVGDCQLVLLDVPPEYEMHRHVHIDQEEVFLCLHGEAIIKEYNEEDRDEIREKVISGIGHGHCTTHMPPGRWHSIQTSDRGAKILAVVKPPFEYEVA